MADKNVSRVTINGNPIMDIHEDTVSPETLKKDETAHDRSGSPIVGTFKGGGDTSDCYKITDPASTDLDDDDYIPFNDVSDAEVPKKKTLFSTIVNKLKDTFLTKLNFKPEGIGSGYCEGTVSGTEITATIDNFVLTKGGLICLRLEAGMPTNATLNISNTGAKSIYWVNGTPIRSMDMPKIVPLTYLLSYDGYHYLIVGVNRTATVSAQGYVADTSGSLTFNNFIGSNALQIKYNLSNDLLYYNYFKNNAWNGDIRLAKYDEVFAALNYYNSLEITNGDLNNYTTPGLYFWSEGNYPNITNTPPLRDSYMMWSLYTSGSSWKRQIAMRRGFADQIWTRIYNNGSSSWSDWNYIGSSVNYGDEIPNNADLNSYKTSGIYNIASNTKASSISNMPIQKAGKLIVMNIAANQYKVQQFIPFDTDCGILYQRSWDNYNSANAWSEWKKIADSFDLNQSVAHTGKNLLCQKTPDIGQIDNGGTTTINGITYTFNSDGSITANGTATADSSLYLATHQYGYMLPKGNYVLSGCPSGGGTDKYFIRLQIKPDDESETSYIDTGSGILFTLNSDARNSSTSNYYIQIRSGQTVSNLVFKPMVRHAYTDATYEKYIPNGQDVKGVVYVGICNTAADQQHKAATVDADFRLKKGVRVAIRFSNTNTYNSTSSAYGTLNVNSTGDKTIYYDRSQAQGTNVSAFGYANRYSYYVYDGSNWVWDGHSVDNNSTNYLPNNGVATLTMAVPQLRGKSSEINAQAADNGVSTTRYPTVNELLDKNDLIIGRDELIVQSNGKIKKFWYVRNYNGSTSAVGQKGLAIEMDKTGNVVWTVHDPQYFNAAIGEGYGTCSTAADQQIKVVTCANFVLCVGAVIHVRFTNTNTYNSTTSAPVKLNVNNTGDKIIYYNNTHGGASNTGANTRIYGEAGRTFTYMYDGTYWVWLGCGYEADTVDPRSLGFGLGTCDTAAATAAKVVTLASYNLRTGGYVTVKFTYDVPANATMNINSKGAKAIYYRGSAITAGVIKAGDRATFVYNGTQYELVSIDRWGQYVEKIIGCWIPYKINQSISVSHDGTKTNETLLAELYAAFKTKWTSLNSGEVIEIIGMYSPNMGEVTPNRFGIYLSNTTADQTFIFSGSHNPGNGYIVTGSIRLQSSNCKLYLANKSASADTFVDNSTTVWANTNKFILRYNILKQI